MPWNGSGAYIPSNGVHTGPTLFQQAEQAGRDIRADDVDGFLGDLKTTIENCLTRDNQTRPNSDLNMNGNKHVNVEDADANDQYAAWGQVKQLVVPTIATLTDAATIVWDVAANPFAQVTIGGDRTLDIRNAVAGGAYALWVKMDATGGHGLTLPAAVDTGALPGTVDMDANAVSYLTFQHALGALRLTGQRGDYI